MKRMFLFSVLLILAACAPQAMTEEPASAIPTVEDSQSFDSIEAAVIQRLVENLGLEKSDVSVKSNEEVEFGDACMDVAFPDVMCAQVG